MADGPSEAGSAEPLRAPVSQLVVIGSSAGGIDALGTVAAGLPDDMPIPVLIAQHLSPHRPSHLQEILQRQTKLKVVSVDDHARLEAGTIYVVPAGTGAQITDHEIRLVAAEPTGPTPSVDQVFGSAAAVFGEGLIAVILTGTGSDGALGAREVKLAGGTVIVQNPDTASYPGMPNSIAPTSIDIVAELEAIGPLLHALAIGEYAPAQPDENRLLQTFLEEMRVVTGIDFNAYKRATILRRLQRRMAATGAPRLRDYIRHVRANPDEHRRLASSFLIKVTQFFRDADLFEHLRTVVIPELIDEARDNERELRIWSAGCATGEEAYSLAILIAEALGEELSDFNVRIFATDLDADAIGFARRGVYPAAALTGIPESIVERHFIRIDDAFEIRRPIRSMTVFGQHDLGQRAPFPRVDLTLCRNVLIYFTPELQRRALQLFAFSLRDGGYLALGKAESTTPLTDHFTLAHPRLKLYRRHGERVVVPPARIRDTIPLSLPVSRRPHGITTLHAVDRDRPMPGAERAENILLRLPVGLVVVDRRYDVQTINSAARRMLTIHSPAVGDDLVHLAPPATAEILRAAIDAALGDLVTSVTLDVPGSGSDAAETTAIRVTVHPLRSSGDAGPIEGAVVLTEDLSATAARDSLPEPDKAVADSERQRLVARARDTSASQAQLLASNLELTTINAELRSANEELLVANEEVQAATEEVETLNEELQATNEELETLNEELQATVEELNTTNEDLEARSVELRRSSRRFDEQRNRAEADRVRMERLLDRLGQGVGIYDPAGQLVIANQPFRDAMDLSATILGTDDRRLAGDALPTARAARGERFTERVVVQRGRGDRGTFEVTASDLGADDPGYSLLEVRRVG